MRERLEYLDSIRGLAAIFVVIGHFLDMYVKHNTTGIVFSSIGSFVGSFELGRVGVVIFFLISGFVVPYSFKGKEGPGVIKKFALKTAFRLYPALWFSIFVAIIIIYIFGHGVGVNVLSFGQVLANVTMIPKYLGMESVQGAYWTLHLLFVFYALCCALFFIRLLNNHKVIISILIFFCLTAILFAFLRYNYNIRIPIVMPLGIASMFLGAVLRVKYSSDIISNKLFFTVICFYFAAMLISQNLYYLDGWPRWFSAYLFAIVIFLYLSVIIKPNNRLLSYIGRISYSMYLLHMLVLAFVFNSLSLNAYSLLGMPISLLLTIILSVILADLSYRFFEMKSANYCRKLISKKYKKL